MFCFKKKCTKLNFFTLRHNQESKTRKLRDLPDQETRVQDKQMKTICTTWEKNVNTLKITLRAWYKVLNFKANFYNPKWYKHLFLTTLTFHNAPFDYQEAQPEVFGMIKIKNMIFIFVGPDMCFNTSNTLLKYLTLYQK